MLGRTRKGNFSKGNPVNLVLDPKSGKMVLPGNQVNWTPSPTAFGNPNPTNPTPLVVPGPLGPLDPGGNFVGGVNGLPVLPTFNPPAATYGVPQVCVIESKGCDALYYTIDGSTPVVPITDTSTTYLYMGSVPIRATTTVQAISVVGGVSSSVASASYTIS